MASSHVNLRISRCRLAATISQLIHPYLQTLYTYPENFRAYKALIAAQYSGAQVKVADNFKFGETNKSAEFLKKFPGGKVSLLFLWVWLVPGHQHDMCP